MLQRYLLLWLTLLSLLALFWERTGVAVDPFVAGKGYLGVMVGVIMFAIGCLLTRDEVAGVFRRWPLVLAGTAIQYVCMPLLAWSIGGLFELEGAARIGVVMVGCVPGAMASNVLTLAARGNVSYSVSLTTSATLLSPLVVPLALLLTLGATHGPDPLAVSVKLLCTVVGPVVAGYLTCHRWPDVEQSLRRAAPIVANVTILWIIAVVVALNRDRLLVVGGALNRGGTGQATSLILAALVLINVGGYLAGYFGGKFLCLPEAMRRALTLEVGMQNAGVGTFLALEFFPDRPDAAIPTAIYTFGCMLTGTILAQWWSRRDPEVGETDVAVDVQ